MPNTIARRRGGICITINEFDKDDNFYSNNNMIWDDDNNQTDGIGGGVGGGVGTSRGVVSYNIIKDKNLNNHYHSTTKWWKVLCWRGKFSSKNYNENQSGAMCHTGRSMTGEG